jgi:hypothetical protein
VTHLVNPEWRFPSGRLFHDPTMPGYDTVFQKTWAHEIGHTMGLTHPDNSDPCEDEVPGASVMNTGCGVNDYPDNMTATSPTQCDNLTVDIMYGNEPCPPDPTPTPTPDPVCTTIDWQEEYWDGCCLWQFVYHEYWCDGVLIHSWYEERVITCDEDC